MIEELLKSMPHEMLKEILQAVTGVDPTPFVSVEALSSNDIRLCNMPPERSSGAVASELPHLFAACIDTLQRANVVSYCDRIVITVKLPGSEPVNLEDDRFYQFQEGVKATDLPLAEAEILRQRAEEGKL